MTRLDRSNEWWARAERVIPCGTQTLSKGPTQFVQGVSPIYLERGRGSHVWDVDGNEYVDFPMALGPVILGYAEPAVDDAIRRQLDDGITFTLMHPLEVEVAERIVALCPGVEAVRFGKSGSDALSAAVRAARAHTGRSQVLVAGYHGWHDWYVGSTTRNRGVPAEVAALTTTFAYNDLDSLAAALAAHRGSVAAVVLEPAGLDTPDDGYLQGVVDLARSAGAVSVFDEVITGFRFAPGGARAAVRGRPRPVLLRQGARERDADLGRGRVVGRHGRLRGRVLLDDPRRGDALAGGRRRRARHHRRRQRPGQGWRSWARPC